LDEIRQAEGGHAERRGVRRRRTGPGSGGRRDGRRWLRHGDSLRGWPREQRRGQRKTEAGTTHPARLSGDILTVEFGTGRVIGRQSTRDMPDAVIYKPCGYRRTAVCPSCAEESAKPLIASETSGTITSQKASGRNTGLVPRRCHLVSNQDPL
jgi:hypothetical protein